MPKFTWSSALSGNWTAASDWNPNGVPGAHGGDTATINATGGNYTVTYDAAAEVINSFTLNSANATLTFNPGTQLTVHGQTELTTGTVNLITSGAVFAASRLTTGANSTVNIGTGDQLTFNEGVIGGLIDLTGTTSFGTSSAPIKLNGTIEATGGVGTVSFPVISGTGVLEANGATLVVASAFHGKVIPLVISDSSSSVLVASGSEFFGETLSASFRGTHGEFEINNPATVANINVDIAGLNAVGPAAAPTNFLDLAGVTVTITNGGTGTGTTGTVTLSNGDALSLTGITGLGPAGWKAVAHSDGSGGTEIFLQSTLCFVAGTLIATDGGERAVEDLRVGDMVRTASGEFRAVQWIGAGNVSAMPGRRDAATPVIIRKGALADNVPHHDLRVTKGHCLYIEDVLIPVEFLVNHRSILWDDHAQQVSLYHVELLSHDVLLANGAPAESYRDDGNRWLFQNANSGWGVTPQPPCAPVLTGGPLVDAIWRRLLDRAGPRPGLPLTGDPDLHLVVNGQRIDALTAQDGRSLFHLPQQASEVRIISRASAPDELGVARDPRVLGIAVRSITIRAGAHQCTIEASDASLCDGFHGYEPDEGIRWTTGDALLPAAHLAAGACSVEIEITTAGMTSYLDEGVPVAA
ncbi:MAG TPA: Hint domain-containing protein [Acetobacteraceae bacterium]|nr:Hint domain-containing protein [Acetobacteraceae bacterium]